MTSAGTKTPDEHPPISATMSGRSESETGHITLLAAGVAFHSLQWLGPLAGDRSPADHCSDSGAPDEFVVDRLVEGVDAGIPGTLGAEPAELDTRVVHVGAIGEEQVRASLYDVER